jgi:hypothetical protein
MMSIDLNSVKDIAAIAGIIISTLTLYNAYNLYRLGKRDSYIREIRNTLITFQYNCKNLNQLINYEIVHELVYHVVYSSQMNRILTKIYTANFNNSTTEEMLDKALEDFDPITTSIHTELLSQYEQTLKGNTQESSKIYTSYPSLYRVYETVNSVFSRTTDITKNIVRDEDIYKKIINEAFTNRDNISNIDDLKEFIFYSFMSGIPGAVLKDSQKDIDDALEILTMTTNNFMGLSDKGLFKQKKRESHIYFKEMDKTDTVFEDLLEAEKGLKSLFTDNEMLLFRELSTRIKVRHESDENA